MAAATTIADGPGVRTVLPPYFRFVELDEINLRQAGCRGEVVGDMKTGLSVLFPKKTSSAPRKHAFLTINSSRLFLKERRNTLEEWMQKLLSDIDFSRSAPVAAFLELEAATRSCISKIGISVSLKQVLQLRAVHTLFVILMNLVQVPSPSPIK